MKFLLWVIKKNEKYQFNIFSVYLDLLWVYYDVSNIHVN